MSDEKATLEELRFLFDSEVTMTFEVENHKDIEILEAMIQLPFKSILYKNIFNLLKESSAEIKMSKILTEEELEIFENFEAHYDKAVKFLDKYDEEFQKLLGE